MNTCVTCAGRQPTPALSKSATTVWAVVTAMTFSASGAAPTPLYQQYQEVFGISPFILTIVFAAYVLSLLAALLTVGSLSDYVGRRPAILAALLMNIAAMMMFMTAGSATALVVARSVQGFATGLATATLGATILDTEPQRGSVLNSITAFSGLTAGSLGAAVLVTYAPDPRQLVYVVLLALSTVEAIVLWQMHETASPRPGALASELALDVLASLRPHIGVPAQARHALAVVTPVTIASWALGGFYFSLMPSLVRIATGINLPIVGGLVVAALTFSAVVSALSFRTASPRLLLRGGIVALASGVVITLAGVDTRLVWLMLAGTVVAGGGFGAVLSGTIRTIMPLAKVEERAGLLSAFYVEGYLSFGLPAVLTGLVAPMLGLTAAAQIYGTAVVLMAFASMVAIMVSRDGS